MTEKQYDDIRRNLLEVEENITAACIASGRSRDEVQLLGVTKTVAPEVINAALSAGLQRIGENRVQELLSKRDSLALDGKEVHLIGHLQTNKVGKVVGIVDMIQSIDSFRLAKAVSDASERIGVVTEVLVEVNIGMETSKSGVPQEELEPLLYEMSSLGGIHVRGLMAIPPIYDTEYEKRAVFLGMKKLFIDIQGKNIDNIDIHVLSMGMSGDYREAVMEGSTLVRVGSALFGRRG